MQRALLKIVQQENRALADRLERLEAKERALERYNTVVNELRMKLKMCDAEGLRSLLVDNEDLFRGSLLIEPGDDPPVVNLSS